MGGVSPVGFFGQGFVVGHNVGHHVGGGGVGADPVEDEPPQGVVTSLGIGTEEVIHGGVVADVGPCFGPVVFEEFVNEDFQGRFDCGEGCGGGQDFDDDLLLNGVGVVEGPVSKSFGGVVVGVDRVNAVRSALFHRLASPTAD